MAGTEVTTRQMLKTAQSIEDIIGQYNNSVNKMYQLGTEIDGMWDGDASSKFMAALNQDRSRFDALSRMFTVYADNLRQDAGVYAKAESDALDVLSSNKIR